MFALYRRGKDPTEWRFVQEVTLAGVLTEAIADNAESKKPQAESTMSWELDREALRKAVVQKFGIDGAVADFKVLIDATWGRDDALLLEIENVYGYSYERWTPVLLQLSVAAEIPKRQNGRKTPVKVIECRPRRRSDFVHEFLYLQCGHLGGRRTWGMMGYTNAVLLYSDAFKYLLSKVGFSEKAQ